jgi:hypothetical protein
MSHDNGQVKFEDGTVLHCEYNGTVDFMCNCLYDNYSDMHQNWRNQLFNTCTCGNDEEVEIATSYGNGYYWEGRACKKCKAITKNLQVEYESECGGLPDWWMIK